MLSVQSLQDFERAQRWMQVEHWVQRLAGHPHELLSFEEVRQLLGLHVAVDRGLQEIELVKIIGSTAKQRDFTRTFHPRNDHDRDRWRRLMSDFIRAALHRLWSNQVGDVYFVHDGHHRISVARAHGVPTLEAHVIEYPTSITNEGVDLRVRDPIVITSRGWTSDPLAGNPLGRATTAFLLMPGTDGWICRNGSGGALLTAGRAIVRRARFQ